MNTICSLFFEPGLHWRRWIRWLKYSVYFILFIFFSVIQMLKNDMLIAISSSENSKNFIRPCEECRKNGGHAITLSAILGTLNQGRCALKPIRLGYFIQIFFWLVQGNDKLIPISDWPVRPEKIDYLFLRFLIILSG